MKAPYNLRRSSMDVVSLVAADVVATHILAPGSRSCFGRAPIPGGTAGLQIRQGLPAIPGGFDSHALPPLDVVPNDLAKFQAQG